MIELLIFAGIFTGMMIAFIAILVAVMSIQSRQSSVAEVTTQSQFLLQQIQSFVERSSLIELPQDISTSTLKLRMATNSEDPTYITLSGGVVYLQQTDGGSQNPLTSSKVTVSSLTFTKHSNPLGHDSVAVSFLIAYASPSVKQQFSETLNTAIARVSAATFDSNLIPSSTAAFDLGVTSNIWRSINNNIYFSGSNVGVGTPSPQSSLDVNGGVGIGTYAGSIAAPSNGLIVSGNVGIGTATPSGGIRLSVADNSNTGGTGLELANTTAGGRTYQIFSTANGNSDASGGKFAIRDSGVSGAAGYRMVIDSSGNVGIGTANPTTRFAIAGTTGVKKVFLISGTTWTVPSDWNNGNNTIEVIGGGGGSDSSGSGGGGGGAYSKAVNVSLTGGASVTYAVGAGGVGVGGNGGDTYFCNSTANCSSISGTAVKVGAKGGTGSVFALVTGTGGAAGSGVGSAKYSGGNGGNGTRLGNTNGAGGGGGGAGGPNGNGNSGTNASGITSGNGGSGGAGSGGSGGSGGSSSFAGTPGGAGSEFDATHGSGGGGGGSVCEDGISRFGGSGGAYGGGAGGACFSFNGVGNQGVILITYTPAPPTTSTLFVVTSDGSVGVGTSNPRAYLDVIGGGTGATIARFNDINSTGCTLASGGTISCSSDIRLKKNIENINYGLDVVRALRPVNYNWKYESDGTDKDLGFIAQEVERVIPQLITVDPSGYKQLNTIGLIPALTKSIQELAGQVDSLKAKNTELETRIQLLESKR